MVDTHDGVPRTPMTMPGTGYTVLVRDAEVEGRLAQGWRKVRQSRRADTGTVPVQGAQQAAQQAAPQSNR